MFALWDRASWQALARKATLARAFAALALLYVLNAFIQSGYISLLELVIGAVWIGLCLLLGGWFRVWMILALGFCLSLAWAFYVESQPISDFLTFHRQARAVVDTGDVLGVLGSKSPPTVAYYALFQAARDGYPTNYVAGAAAWTAGAYMIYRSASTILNNAFLARFVCAALVFYPSFVAAAAVPSSEAIYFLLSGIGVWAMTQAVGAEGNRRLAYAALTGFLIGWLYLTRMNALVLLLPCGFVLVAWGRDGPSALAPALAGLGIARCWPRRRGVRIRVPVGGQGRRTLDSTIAPRRTEPAVRHQPVDEGRIQPGGQDALGFLIRRPRNPGRSTPKGNRTRVGEDP